MFPLVYYVVFFDTRYGYPMNQSLLFLASFAFLHALKSIDRPAPGDSIFQHIMNILLWRAWWIPQNNFE